MAGLCTVELTYTWDNAMRKNIILAVLVVILLFGVVFLMDDLRRDRKPIGDIVDEFNKVVSEIKLQEDTSVKSEIDISSDSAEGGAGLIYRQDRIPIKFVATYYGETGQRRLEFFINKKKIIKIVDLITYYVEPINADRDVQIASEVVKNYYVIGSDVYRQEDNEELHNIKGAEEYDYFMEKMGYIYQQILAD